MCFVGGGGGGGLYNKYFVLSYINECFKYIVSVGLHTILQDIIGYAEK